MGDCRSSVTNVAHRHSWTAVKQECKYILHRLSDWMPVQICRRVKWFWQRGRRGWADCDTWSLDRHLAQIIAGGCCYLADMTHGYPSGGPVDDIFRPNVLSETDNAQFGQWKDTLREIAAGFRAWGEDEWETPEQHDMLVAQLEHSLALFHKWFPALWD